MQNLLIGAGIVLVVSGLLYPSLKHLPLERLPGDIVVKSGASSLFFPIVTCLLISVVLTFILNLLS